ncbi:MAG: hypothetical protein ACTSX6_04670 [Candidatus Heimdallarchaeaceae archaeon]
MIADKEERLNDVIIGILKDVAANTIIHGERVNESSVLTTYEAYKKKYYLLDAYFKTLDAIGKYIR